MVWSVRTVLGIAGSTSVALALSVGISTSAFAGTDQFAIYQTFKGNCTGQSYDAWAYFQADGDKIKAADQCADGHSAVTEWKVGASGTVRKVWDHDGAETVR